MNTKVINVVKRFGADVSYWGTKDRELNELAVIKILDKCYCRFRTRGVMFLNEVYEELGIPWTKQGQVDGWVFGEENGQDHMWSVWTKNDESADVYITFEPIEDITYMLQE